MRQLKFLVNNMDNEYLERFKGICKEINIDPSKILSNPPPILGQLVREWMIGNINDLGMMRSLRNLAIMNPKFIDEEPNSAQLQG